MTALGSQLTRLASNRSPTTGRICLWIVRTARRQAQIVRCQTQRRAALHQAAITHQQSAIHTRRDGVAPFEGRVGGVRVNTHTLSGAAAADSWLCCRKARRRASELAREIPRGGRDGTAAPRVRPSAGCASGWAWRRPVQAAGWRRSAVRQCAAARAACTGRPRGSLGVGGGRAPEESRSQYTAHVAHEDVQRVSQRPRVTVRVPVLAVDVVVILKEAVVRV